jgi:UDP-2-acetamido-3-amino-2,3-dideoxy-glucuronate N-acetyltransferase
MDRASPTEDGALTVSPRAPGLALGAGVVLPDDVELGAHVVIHSGTVVGAGARIQDGAVLGKPLALGARSTAPRRLPPPLEVGAGVTVGAGAVVLRGARIGPRAVVGDQAHVRERAVVGEESVVGRGSAVDCDVTIGARVRIQTGCYLSAFSVLEDDVFVAPGVTTTNDHAMARHAAGERLRGATLRRACRVGGGAVLLPGIEVGEDAFVAAGSVVTRSVAPRAVVMGVPARRVGAVPDEDLLERWS